MSATEREGNLSVSVRVDKRITSALNAPGSFTGRVNNSANVGKTTGEIVQMWNEAHPEDMIVLPLNHKAQPQSASRSLHVSKRLDSPPMTVSIRRFH